MIGRKGADGNRGPTGKKKAQIQKKPGFTLFATRQSLFRAFWGRLQVKKM